MAEAIKVPRLLTVKQAAQATGLPRWRLYALLAEGTGPAAMRVGKTYRISEHALIRWIEDQHAA